MPTKLNLRGRVASNVAVDPADTVNTKKVMADLGLYDTRQNPIDPIVDSPMFDAIKEFQERHGLEVDGAMTPRGPTKKLVEAELFERGAGAAARKRVFGVAGPVGDGAANLPAHVRSAGNALACTNAIENAIGTVRTVSRNVKRWRNVEMALRWTAAGMLEAQKTFRRLKAYRQLPILRKALQEHIRQAQANDPLETIMTAA